MEPQVKITVSEVYDYNPSDSQVPFKARNVDYTDPGPNVPADRVRQNAGAVDTYIKPLALCFEAQQITLPDNLALLAQVDEMQPDVILREEAVKAAGYDPAQTSDLLQKYVTAIAAGEVTDVKNGNPSLASLLRWAGADPMKNPGAALDRFTSEWGAKWSQVPGEAYSVVKDSYSAALSDDGSDRLAAFDPPSSSAGARRPVWRSGSRHGEVRLAQLSPREAGRMERLLRARSLAAPVQVAPLRVEMDANGLDPGPVDSGSRRLSVALEWRLQLPRFKLGGHRQLVKVAERLDREQLLVSSSAVWLGCLERLRYVWDVVEFGVLHPTPDRQEGGAMPRPALPARREPARPAR